MNYEVKDTNWVSPPRLKDGDPTKVTVFVNVTAGIAGQTYEGFSNVDSMEAEFPISMTGIEMQVETAVQAAAFVAKKYPNV